MTAPALPVSGESLRSWAPLVIPASALFVLGLFSTEAALLLLAGVAGLAAVWVIWHLDPAWTLSIGLALMVFNGRWSDIGVPLGPDRVFIIIGIAAVLLRGPAMVNRPRLRIVPGVWLLGALLIVIVGSSLFNDSLGDRTGFLDLLDGIGVVPLLMLLAAPFAFRTPRQRAILLGTLILLGAYLGLTALFETVGPEVLVQPAYILDPDVGLHADRARGPLVEAVHNGLALFGCACAALIGALSFREPAVKYFALGVAVLCLMGCLFTLTRSIWLAVAVSMLFCVLAFKPLRRYAAGMTLLGVILVVGLLVLVPGLSDSADSRAQSQLPVWDRLNLNSAAASAVADRPLTGLGWGQFEEEGVPYFRLAANRPVTGVGQPAHNTFLGHAAELGLPGVMLWVIAMGSIAAAAVGRRAPEGYEYWRIAFVAYAIALVIVANFVMLIYPFAILLFCALAGLLMGPRLYDEVEMRAALGERPATPATAGA